MFSVYKNAELSVQKHNMKRYTNTCNIITVTNFLKKLHLYNGIAAILIWHDSHSDFVFWDQTESVTARDK